MRNSLLIVWTSLVTITASGLAGVPAEGNTPQARLVETKEILVLSADTTVRENRGLGSMKLSPDGTKLLYIRRRAVKPDPSGRERRAHDLVLRDIETNKEKVLKIPAYTWDDIAVMMLSMNVFDAAGKRIVLGIGVDTNGNGLHDTRGEGKEELQVALYDLATDKITRIPASGQIALATFDGSRKSLIIVVADKRAQSGKTYTTPADKIQLRELSLWGLPRGPCPTADLLALLLPPDRKAPRRPKPEFVLLDLAKDKVVAKLPIRGRNTKLDDYCPQWTADGRYLYYIDVDSEPGPDGRPRRKFETRIWDRTTAEQAGDVPRAVAIGPGPTKTSMVLCSLDDRSVSVLMVHDLPAGKLWKVAGGPVCPISMQGKHLLYVKPSADGKETLYLARIELPRSP